MRIRQREIEGILEECESKRPSVTKGLQRPMNCNIRTE
jgi:hypothetical protein